MRECEHRHIRKNYSFGRKSNPDMKCLDCGEPIKPHDLMDRKKRRKYGKSKNK